MGVGLRDSLRVEGGGWQQRSRMEQGLALALGSSGESRADEPPGPMFLKGCVTMHPYIMQ